MRLQYFGSSTQEGQFAAMLSDRALHGDHGNEVTG